MSLGRWPRLAHSGNVVPRGLARRLGQPTVQHVQFLVGLRDSLVARLPIPVAWFFERPWTLDRQVCVMVGGHARPGPLGGGALELLIHVCNNDVLALRWSILSRNDELFHVLGEGLPFLSGSR